MLILPAPNPGVPTVIAVIELTATCSAMRLENGSESEPSKVACL
jgi:hypothetical protein